MNQELREKVMALSNLHAASLLIFLCGYMGIRLSGSKEFAEGIEAFFETHKEMMDNERSKEA